MEIKEYVIKRKQEMIEEISKLDRAPVLSIVSVGHNPASESYMKGKCKDSADVGITAIRTSLEETATEEDLLNIIRTQNEDPSIDGIIVQLPVPAGIKESSIIDTISKEKDVDGFRKDSPFVSCTPKGIVDYLTREGFIFSGKNAVVMGRSNIVGRPMAKLLLDRSCNVTVIHSRTSEEDKKWYLAHADLIVVAIGKEAILNSSYELKESAWIVDVGINRGEDGKLHGDVEPNLKVAKQTPVPGGVGLLTRLALIENVLEAYKNK
ncbi:MAG: bifunctional 5,10-methylenetetrahydrofolate dehydrogenase/5,10-methenyltetrahydrofolate cyclohydrolase [Bacilli bacterium]|nr:bifunctional 5,10-methylenetetrahydrofolate dehydrogenase/5,10-methenyltetrahydrofolate cyclohydrolase [Bacilli bacterium]